MSRLTAQNSTLSTGDDGDPILLPVIVPVIASFNSSRIEETLSVLLRTHTVFSIY